MRANRFRTVCALAVAAACSLQCGAASAIGLKQAFEAALQNDPTYRSALFDREAGREYKTLGKAYLLPNLSASYSTSQNRVDLQTNVLSHPVYISKAANISLRQSLVNLDGLARYKEGIIQSNYSEVQFTGRAQDLAQRVVQAYLETLLADEQLTLMTAQRDALREQRVVNDRLFSQGEGTKTDMLETQARLDLAEAQVIEANDALVAARNGLSALVGSEVTAVDPLVPDFKLPEPDYGSIDKWKTLARERNPDLLSQKYSIDMARQEINRNRAGHSPRVDFIANYSKNDSETLNTFNQLSTQRSIGVQLSIPLYAGGSVNASSRQAVANHERAKADMDAKVDKVMLDIRKQYDAMVSSYAHIAALEKAVASSTLLVQATANSIKGGVRINLDLLNAQQQLFQGKRDLAQARFNYMLAVVRLKGDAGTLGPDHINQMATYFR